MAPEDEARISPYHFHTDAPMVRRSVCIKAGLWREDDTFAQESECFARLKYFSKKTVYVDKVQGTYVRHQNTSIFNGASLPFALAGFKIMIAIKALVIYGRYDSKCKRHYLAHAFRGLAKRLIRFGAYRDASDALQESLVLRWTPKVFAAWVPIKILACLQGKIDPGVEAHR